MTKRAWDSPEMQDFALWFNRQGMQTVSSNARCPICQNWSQVYRYPDSQMCACSHCWRSRYFVQVGILNEHGAGGNES